MARYDKLAKFLKRRQAEISKERGEYVPWDYFANKIGAAPQTMSRFKDGKSLPASYLRPAMAEVFGPDVWAAMGMLPPDVDPAFLRLYLGAKQDPNLKRILDDAMEQAQKYQEKQPTTGQLSFV